MILKENTTVWLAYRLILTDGTEITGRTYDTVICKYKSAGSSTWNTRTLTADDFREIGNGIYMVKWPGNMVGTMANNDNSFITYLHPNVVDGLPAVRNDEVLSSFYFQQQAIVPGLQKLTIFSKTSSDETIPATLHSIFSGSTFVTSKLSDDEGKSVFSLMPGNFEIRAYKTGYYFPPQVITLADADVTATITGDPLIYTPAPSPTACRVHIYAVDLGLSPVSGILVEVNYDLPEKVGDKIGAGRIRKLYTDSEGHTYFDAPQGSMVKVIIPLARIDQVVRIPVDKVAVSITELLTFR